MLQTQNSCAIILITTIVVMDMLAGIKKNSLNEKNYDTDCCAYSWIVNLDLKEQGLYQFDE